MTDRVITNPIIDGPYDEPSPALPFDADGITDEIVDGRPGLLLLTENTHHAAERVWDELLRPSLPRPLRRQ